MLELKNIVKDYVSGNNVTHALKGISVNFRKNEFVSILGASGCGKTTTLNIIGGLDRYTSGDLIINGKSTKDYKDRDWDTYRNHSIGFIFQSYNLIGHQNILKNVELALTISGVSKAERKERASKALEIVGLAGMEKKKPNQLSGGQCQRVAIARALINNPEIVLADEPTGALDSETSVQIMDLLEEVAKDRLVIMVTHNPDLAKKYSTRIITMSDGVLLKDSNPFDGKEEKVKEVSKGKKKQTSMSLLTSTGLSLANLGSKLKRTILVTIAGSIGIIGVSAVLAVSRGVKDFIGNMQNDMLSNYPIGIAEESVDYTSLMTGLNENKSKEALEFDINTELGVDSMINFLMTAYSDITSVKTNTINEELIDYIDQIDPSTVASIYKNYGIDPTNNIFTSWTHDFNKADENKSDKNSDIVSLNGLTQSYIAELKTVNGFKSYASYVNLFTGFMNELPGSESYLLDQYDLISGSKFATEENEMMLVVDGNTTLTDLLLAEMGVYEHDDFINIAKLAIKKNEILDDDPQRKEKIDALEEKYSYNKTFKFESLLNRDFYYYPQSALYDTNASSKVADDEPYVGITVMKMSNPIVIPPDPTPVKTIEQMYSLQYDQHDKITGSFISMGAGNQIAFDQLEFSRVGTPVKPDINNLIASVNGEWVATNKSGEEVKLTFVSPMVVSIKIGDDPAQELGAMVAPDTKKIYGANYDSFIESDRADMIANPSNYGGMKMKITGILRLKGDRNFGSLDRGLYFTPKFAKRYMDDAALDSEKGTLTKAFTDHILGYKSNEENQKGFNAYVKFKYIDHTDDVESSIPEENKTHGKVSNGCATALNGDMSSSFSDLFSAITGVNYLEQDTVHLRSICGLKTLVSRNEDETISAINFKALPKSISIYPNDFATKNMITEHLDKWNSETEDITVFKGTPNEKVLKPSDNVRDELTYTDTIELIIAVITTFIDAITIALVVFTSLSLVVSCFMIAVITYISVVERIKEIGIIRSLGGRKQNVASLFIMENLLTGLFSGAFGIGLTYVLQIVLNTILKVKFGIVIANLTPWTALIMIGISILLSVMSGLIPSQSAAHKDPVVALRSAE